MTVLLSRAEARRIAVSAARLGRPRSPKIGRAEFNAMMAHLGMVQIDSINVLARAHYMPGLSRLGEYDRSLLDRACEGEDRTLFEYWGHEACFIDTNLQPMLRWRMEDARAGKGIYSGTAKFVSERRSYIDEVLDHVRRNGPTVASDLPDHRGHATGGWWNWSLPKKALEYLFYAGFVTTHSRKGFGRVYDLTERVLPNISAQPTPDRAEAQRNLVSIAARVTGIATQADLRAHWRMNSIDCKARIAELVEDGVLLTAKVEGSGATWYLASDLPDVKPATGEALLSPFDPMLWQRDRVAHLFNFDYRIEIYVPESKRQYGYYVLPLLIEDSLVARLDLKADRKANVLRVLSAHFEVGESDERVAVATMRELRVLCQWLGLAQLDIANRGNLAPALVHLLRGDQ
jgi:uncharacterized protein YcaQ